MSSIASLRFAEEAVESLRVNMDVENGRTQLAQDLVAFPHGTRSRLKAPDETDHVFAFFT